MFSITSLQYLKGKIVAQFIVFYSASYFISICIFCKKLNVNNCSNSAFVLQGADGHFVPRPRYEVTILVTVRSVPKVRSVQGTKWQKCPTSFLLINNFIYLYIYHKCSQICIKIAWLKTWIFLLERFFVVVNETK